MLKVILIILMAIQVTYAKKLSMDERRRGIIAIIDEELSEVSRLAKQQDYGSPDTLLRLSELYLEKARLWRETENEQFLSIPPEQRRRLDKKEYFKNSMNLYSAANKSAAIVVRKFPKYRNIAEIYFILAFNLKELGKHKEAQKYFDLTAKKASPGTPISYKSKLALADYYFNDHKYSKAAELYDASISKVNDKWWTKDSYNLAWCYYRLRRYDQAISLMKEVHQRSQNDNYVDMRPSVERDIGIFYVDAGRMPDAARFYESLGINYTEQFVRIASSITSQGRFSQAESLLSQAEKFEKDQGRRVEILLAQLDLFDKYNKIPAHLRASKELVSLHQQGVLNSDQTKKLIYHLDRKAAELQKATASSTYQNVSKTKNEKSAQSIQYFELSGIVSPDKKSEKMFFQAETAYAAGNYAKALSIYVNTFDFAKARGEKKIISQSLEGMLSSLGQKGLSSKVADQYYGPIYERYLSIDSRSERAKTIFGKLFNFQFSAGKINESEQTLKRFVENFPSDYKMQEDMLAKIMDHYRKKKDYTTVKSYVSQINEGKFKVSKKYADALRTLMTKFQIEGVQQSLNKGEKATALKGYHQIYESTESTPKAKVNAAYNLSALYYDLGDIVKSYKWATIALRDMDAAEVVKLADSYLSIAAGIFLKQQFNLSADLSYRVLAKLCKLNSSNKTVGYKNAVFISLANGDIDKAIEIRKFGKECLIADKVISEVSIEVLRDLADARRWDKFEKLIQELEKDAKNFPSLIKPIEQLRTQFLRQGDNESANSIESKQWRYYKQAKAQQLDIPVDALDIMASKMVLELQQKEAKLDQIKLIFPEATFNNAVKSKLQILDSLTAQVAEIQKIGSGKGIVDAYRIVIDTYEKFGNELKDFSPEGKSPEYLASFKNAMADVYRPILSNALKQRSEIKKLILKNKILAGSNYAVMFSVEDNFKRFITPKESALMDRGGRR